MIRFLGSILCLETNHRRQSSQLADLEAEAKQSAIPWNLGTCCKRVVDPLLKPDWVSGMLRLPINLHLTPLPPSSLKGFLLGSPVQEGMPLELGRKKEMCMFRMMDILFSRVGQSDCCVFMMKSCIVESSGFV